MFGNRKIKCNGNLDGCAHCEEKGQKCKYEPVPDDEKLKARSYKRQLIQRRQQTRVYFDRRPYPDSSMMAAAYGMTPSPTMAAFPMGFYSPQPSVYTSQPNTPQFASPFPSPTTSSSMDHGMNACSAPAFASPDSSAQLQHIMGTSSFAHPIPAPLVLESLSSSPPMLSPSSSASSLMTPTSEVYCELGAPFSASLAAPAAAPAAFDKISCTPEQVHFHDFARGLEIYNVPCMSASNQASPMADDSQPSSAYSSPEHLFVPLPAQFDFASALESAVAASSTLAGALA